MAKLPTVLIKRGKQEVLINLKDYDEKRDGKIIEKEVKEVEPVKAETVPAPSAPDPANAVAPQNPSPEQLLVEKKGKKFIIVNQDGKPVERDGIETKGYDDELAAWSAIAAVAPPKGD